MRNLFISVLASAACIRVLARDSPAAIHWEACPPTYPASLQCGNLSLPIDYDNETVGSFNEAIVRLPCIDNSTTQGDNDTSKCGNLILNFGGPGVSTMAIFAKTEPDGLASAIVRQRYNLVGPDIRGVGESSGIKCDNEIFNKRVSINVSTQAEVDELVARNKAMGESCARMTGPLFNYLDTASAARDLDEIRQALGDDKLNYLGISYGTLLGAQYAELFPDRVGKMVLDGNVEHSQNSMDLLITEVQTLEDTFNVFLGWCNTSSTCAFHNQNLPSIFDKLVDEASSKPIPAPGCHGPTPKCRPDVTGVELVSSVQGMLTSTRSWPKLSHALREATDGNATLFSEKLLYNGGNNSADPANFPMAFLAIACADGWGQEPISSVGESLNTTTTTTTTTTASSNRAASNLIARIMAARALAPHTRGITEGLDAQASCLGWPSPVRNPRRMLDAERLKMAPPVLLVNALHDPSTSVVWAVGLRAQMPNAVSVFRDGAGHGSYIGGETQRVEDEFLVEGRVPGDMTHYPS